MKKLVYRGVLYKNAAELARKIGIPPSTLQRRLLNTEKDIEVCCLKVAPGNRAGSLNLKYKGKYFTSIAQLTDYLGCTLMQYNYRKKQGWTIEQIEEHYRAKNRI